MRIDVADSQSEQTLAIDESQHFHVRCDDGTRQFIQYGEHKLTLSQMAKRYLADDEWMHQNFALIEQRDKRIVAAAQMINPD